ncbi:hypothetical protein A7K94_0216460 [Modestobacter sp. VKM Ac-2676]|nr:hypothetical protein A7K94_0216460 [Modestobacter sp. VKM Ac-2676]
MPEGPDRRDQPDRVLHPAPPRQAPAPGWRSRLHPDGRLTVTTPTGLTSTTTPPRYATRLEDDPPPF